MANVFIAEETMTAIGEAIREKTGKTELILPANMPAEIKGITGDGSGESSDLVKYVTFMSENGTTELYKMPVLVGDDCKDPIAHGDIDTPKKESTNALNFTYSGWALISGGTANGSILKNITKDITVYAAFVESVRYYTVRFYSDDELHSTVQVTYGGTATAPNVEKTGYKLSEWLPSNENITADTDCYAQWTVDDGIIHEDWDTVIERANQGTLQEYYKIGDKKELSLTYSDGTSDTLYMVIGAMNDTKITSIDSAYPVPNAVFIADRLLSKTSKARNGNGTNTYYPFIGGALDTFLKNEVATALPEVLQNGIAVRRVMCGYSETEDYSVWVPNDDEVAENIYGDAYFDIMMDNNARIRRIGDIANSWWLRSYRSASTVRYNDYVGADGGIVQKANDNTVERGVLICFNLGTKAT